MELLTCSTQQNELIRINVNQIVALKSFINDGATKATLEIITTSPKADIKREFDDVDKMKEEFERIENIISGKEDSARNVINSVINRTRR